MPEKAFGAWRGVVTVKRPSLLVTVGAAMLLVPIVTGQAQAKVFGPNGQIAFTRSDRAADEDFTYTVNPDGSNMQPLLPGFTSDSPHWSPDGSEVAVGSSLGVPCCNFPYSAVIINPDTGSYRTLPMQDPNVFTFCRIWSPDATQLACDGENDSDPSVNGIYTVRSSDGGGLTRITDARGGIDVPIDYSPDGNQIVFGRLSANFECTTKSALFVVNVDGSDFRQITPPGFCDEDGSWSPDGSKIAFEHRGSLFTVHPDGTGLAKVPLAIGVRYFAGDFVWSPDGTKIVFLLFKQAGPQTFQEGIATANADGSNVQQVTVAPSGLFDHEPDWGPHPLTT
jgi:Tol biopolymer transport system component